MESLGLLTAGFVFSSKFKLIPKVPRRIKPQCITRSLVGDGRFYIYKFALPVAIPDKLALLHCRSQPASGPQI